MLSEVGVEQKKFPRALEQGLIPSVVVSIVVEHWKGAQVQIAWETTSR